MLFDSYYKLSIISYLFVQVCFTDTISSPSLYHSFVWEVICTCIGHYGALCSIFYLFIFFYSMYESIITMIFVSFFSFPIFFFWRKMMATLNWSLSFCFDSYGINLLYLNKYLQPIYIILYYMLTNWITRTV